MEILSKGYLLNEVYKVGEAKAKNSFERFFALGFLAGTFIALSGLIYLMVSGGMYGMNSLVVKLVGGVCFTFGIFSVVVAGADLFTGNILMFAGYLAKKYGVNALVKNWTLVYLFNLLGSIFIALLVYYSGSATEEVVKYLDKAVLAKVSGSFMPLLLKGIGCNFIVCLGVWMSYATKDLVGKYVAVAIPIVIFVVEGFEHSVANMFYFSLSFIMGKVSMGQIFGNLIPVTIGNILGGMIIAGLYYVAYRTKEEK